MTASATVDLTEKVAWPAAFVVPVVVAIVELPVPCVSETSLPGTGWPYASSSVTVTVEVAAPFVFVEEEHPGHSNARQNDESG